MPYIGKPQSSDPITVNASNIEDGSIIAADISSSLGVAISGSFTTVSSSLGSRVTLVEGGTTSKTLVSSSAQIATSISGSSTSLSSSLSTRATTLESASGSFASDLVTLKGSGTTQGVGQSNSPTFAGGTVTGDFTVGGTLTAQEIHTEFESASILFTSGSTILGNSSDDVHSMTGSLNISGSLTLNDGALTVTDNVDFNGDLDVEGTTNLDVVDIDGAVTQDGGHFIINEGGADYDFRVESDGNENALRVDGQQGFIGMGASAPGYVNGQDHRGGNTQTTSGAGGLLHLEGLVPRIILDDTGDTPQFAIEAQDYFSILELNDSHTGESTRLRIAKSTGNVGIGGVTSPAEPLHVSGSDSGIRIQARSGTRGTLSFYTAGGALEGKISTNGNDFLSLGGGSSAGDHLTINNSGYVGIGTNNAGMQLEIRGTGVQEQRIYSTNSVGRMTIRGATQGDLFLTDESGGSNLKTIQLVQVDDLFKVRQITDAGGLGNENLLVIKPGDSNVGIDTSNPQRTFVISDGGNGGIEFGPGASTNIMSNFNRGTSSYATLQIESSAVKIYTGTSSDKLLNIDSSGNISGSGEIKNQDGTKIYTNERFGKIEGADGPTTSGADGTPHTESIDMPEGSHILTATMGRTEVHIGAVYLIIVPPHGSNVINCSVTQLGYGSYASTSLIQVQNQNNGSAFGFNSNSDGIIKIIYTNDDSNNWQYWSWSYTTLGVVRT